MRALTSATGRSTSRSSNSVQKPNVDSSSMASTRARLYGCACASSSTERPVDHIHAPSRMTRKPSPPESTTPALRSASSCDRRGGDRVARRAHDLPEHVRQVSARAGGGLGSHARFAGHRQDRALDGLG